MMIPGIPVEIPIRALLIAGTVATVAVALSAALWLAYREGRGSEQREALVASAEAIAESQIAQGKREVNHARRVEKIARGVIAPADVSRLLSETPSENTATRSAIETAR